MTSLVLLAACAAPDLPHEVRRDAITSPRTHWDAWVEMVPPVHVPQPGPGDPQVRVHLRLPDGGRVSLVETADGRRVPSWPPGTIADRVETRGDRVVDVRGTSIDAQGRRWHHVYRPGHRHPAAPPVGVEVPAGHPDAGRRAVEVFLDARGDTEIVKASKDPEAHLQAVRDKLDCDGCHVPLRPDNTVKGEHGLVSRGTDAAGWFVPATVLAADVPLETWGRYDPNLADPFVRARCPSGEVTLPQAGKGHASCADGALPRAALDVPAALAANDAHALGYCASWRHLVSHLEDAGAFAGHPCAEGS